MCIKIPRGESQHPALSQDGLLFLFAWAALVWSASMSHLIAPTTQNNVTLTAVLMRASITDPLPGVWGFVLALYLVADVWLRGRAQAWGKNIALSCMVIGFLLLPTVLAIIYRSSSQPHTFVHDGAIQVEQAAQFFLRGQNPYTVDYTRTPMAEWPFSEDGLKVNPALYHLPYLPLLWLGTIPFALVFQNVLGWYDVRVVYLVCFLASLILILHSRLFRENRFSAAIVLALNPLLIPFLIEGRNDIVVSFWLVVALVLLNKQRLGMAGLAVAAAVASKQTAWFIVPFFVMYVWACGEKTSWAGRLKPLLPGLFLLALCVVPFWLWDPNAFWDDVVSYQSGAGGGVVYPIKSLGFGSVLLGSGLVENNTDAFPFVWLQLVFGIPLVVWLLRRQLKEQSLMRLVLNYALLLSVILFFSRTFNDNHLGFVITWLGLAFLLPGAKYPSPMIEP